MYNFSNIDSPILFTPNIKDIFKGFWKYRFALIALLISVASIALVIVQVQKRQRLETEAATDQANIFFTPNTDNLYQTEKTYPLWINASADVAFSRVVINFDNTKLVLTRDPALVNTSLTQTVEVTNAATANNTGTIVVALGLAPGLTAPTGTFQLANLYFRSKNTTASTTQVNVNLNNSQLVNTSAVAFTLTNSVLSLNLNASGTALLSFANPNPANPQLVGTNFSVDLMMDTGNVNVSGVDAIVRFSSTYFDFVSITANNSVFSSVPAARYEAGTGGNNTGTVYFSANIGTNPSAPAVNGSAVKLATLTLKPKATANTSLDYYFIPGSRNDSNILAYDGISTQDPTDLLSNVSNLNININPTVVSPTPSPSLTPSPSPSPSVIPSPSPSIVPSPSPSPSPSPRLITLTFGLQGRSRPETSKIIDLTVSYKREGLTGTQTSNLRTNSSGQVSLNLTPGNYVFLVKGEGYLARRFGTSGAPIILSTTAANLDLSGTLLLGGDLNGDGTVNEIDYTMKYLPTFGTADTLADLDGSGQVNTLDFGVMRNNWNLADDVYQ